MCFSKKTISFCLHLKLPLCISISICDTLLVFAKLSFVEILQKKLHHLLLARKQTLFPIEVQMIVLKFLHQLVHTTSQYGI